MDDEAEEKSSIIKLEVEMYLLKVDIKGNMTVLASLTGVVLRAEQHVQTMGMLGEGESKLRRYMECSSAVAESMETDESDKQLKPGQHFYESASSKLLELRGSLVKQTPVKNEPTLHSVRPAQASAARDSVSGLRKEPVKIKAMECPKWDGRYRTFVRFKKLWDENIAPRHEDSALHYKLCESLPKRVLDFCSVVHTLVFYNLLIGLDLIKFC